VTTTGANRWAVLAVLAGALAVISLDNTIVNVALPVLQQELDATTSQLQWVVDAYSVMFAGTLLLAGALGDRFGRRRALLIGLVIFGSASLAAGFANHALTLALFRALMGIGGAFIMPSTLSILTQVFTDRRERAQAIGIWAATAGAAVAIGPIVGGLLVEYVSWHAIFWVNPPLVVIGILATLRYVPESLDPSKPRLDPLGAILSTVGLVALVVTVIEIPDSGINPLTITSSIATIVFLSAFVWWELRAPRPMLPMSLFRSRLFSVSVICVALVYASLMGMMFFLPQFLQLVQGNTPVESGLSMLPGAGGMLIASLFSPRVAERIGTRTTVLIGFFLVTVGFGVAAFMDAGSPYVLVGGSLGIIGFGLGMVLPQATNGVLAATPPERAGIGAAVNDGMSELGGSLGVAILGSLLALGYRNEIEARIAAAGDAINTIPANVVEAVRESLAAGSIAVQQLAPDVATPIREAAGQAFVSGMTTALLVGGGLTLVGLVLAWWLFPAKVERVEE